MHKRSVYVIFTMIACLAASPAFAKKYYKWSDADGTTTYTLTKPQQDVPFEVVDDSSGAYSDAAAAQATATEESAKTEKSAEATGTPAVEERKKQQEAECKQMREHLATLQTKARVREIQPDGTQRMMTAEEHQAAIDRATDYLKDCP